MAETATAHTKAATAAPQRPIGAPRPAETIGAPTAEQSAQRRKRAQDFQLFRSVARKFFGEPPADAGHQRMTARAGYGVAIGGEETLALPESAKRARPTLAWTDASAPEARTVEVFYGERALTSHRRLAQERLRKEWADPVERGAALLYAQGDDGLVSLVLYPAETSNMKAEEDAILLERRRDLEAMTGRGALERHWRALRAYAEVTSLDGEPSWAQTALVAWLRYTRPTVLDGRRRAPAILGAAEAGLRFAAAVTLAALIVSAFV